MYKNSLNFLVFLLISLFFIAGCTKNEDEKTAEKKIATPEELAEKRWDALIAKDWGKAYNFETPSYKLASTVEDYKNSFGTAITWISAKTISSKEISEKVIDVDVELTIEFSEGGGKMMIPSVFTERWLKVDDNWWHVMKE